MVSAPGAALGPAARPGGLKSGLPGPDQPGVRALAEDDEQVAFWERHTRLGVVLCVVLPAVVAGHTVAQAAPEHPYAVYALAAAVALLSPLILLVPVARLVRHPLGRLFFDGWEAVGTGLVVAFALLDGGADSPYTMIFYVLLAHAALAYPPVGMAIAGAGNVVGYLVVCVFGGGVPAADVVAGVLLLAVATGTCAFASYNHVRAYRRTAAYARQIALLAERDGLTGCLNHRAFHQRLQAEGTGADADRPLSLLLIDVDDFKSVNDTHGHPAGDAVLQMVGSTLLDVCRAQDVPGRLGGDEFALLLPATGLAEAAAVAERVRRRAGTGGQAYVATVSIGIATTSVRGDAAGLLSAADRAVYRAKRAGRDQVAGAAPVAVPGPRQGLVERSRTR